MKRSRPSTSCGGRFWCCSPCSSPAGAPSLASRVLVERLQAAARKSALAARRLGQYVLVQEIGRGANGMVYRARHSLLRRPVAIKLLSPDMTNEANAARFEHEVQMTSQREPYGPITRGVLTGAGIQKRHGRS